jgi:hypothetical protein
MKASLRRLKAVIEHPATQLTTGMILLISGLATAYYEFSSTERTFRLGVHHGVFLWGLVQVLGSIPNLVEGVAQTVQVAEKGRKTEP